MKKWMFYKFVDNYLSPKGIDQLNELIEKDGWIPVRETGCSNFVLVLLCKNLKVADVEIKEIKNDEY